jgi:hypothetical protein
MLHPSVAAHFSTMDPDDGPLAVRDVRYGARQALRAIAHHTYFAAIMLPAQ